MCLSEPEDVTSGVPQGTYQGLFFLVDDNDLEKAVEISSSANFADDTRLTAPISFKPGN